MYVGLSQNKIQCVFMERDVNRFTAENIFDQLCLSDSVHLHTDTLSAISKQSAV